MPGGDLYIFISRAEYPTDDNADLYSCASIMGPRTHAVVFTLYFFGTTLSYSGAVLTPFVLSWL